MDYGKAFSFVFEDEKWVSKVLIAGLLAMFSFFIIPIFPLVGYLAELLQNVARGDPRPLPEWDNIGAKFTKGLSVFVIGLVYSLPLILVSCCFVGLTSVLGANTGSSPRSGGDTGSNLAGLLGLCFGCFAFIYVLVLTVIAPAAITRYAVADRVADAFKLADVVAYIRSNVGNYIVAILLGLVAGFIAQFGAIACFIGLFFTTAWAQMVQYHLLGQVYRNSLSPSAPGMGAMPVTPAM